MRDGLKKLLLAAAIGGISVNAIAAEDGQNSTTRSIGNFEITLFNETLVQVYGLVDVDLTDTTTTGQTPLCVASNVDNYEVAMSSDTAFKLDGPGDDVPYTLQITQNSSNIAGASWGANGTLGSGAYYTAGLSKDASLADANDDLAGTTCTANRFINIDLGTLPNNLTAGQYTDLVTVTVAPL